MNIGINYEPVRVIGDSKVVIDQMKGLSRISAERVLLLHHKACRLALILFGLLELVFLGIIYQGFRNDPITWEGIIVFGGFAVFVGWVMFYIIRLRRAPRIYFDAQLREIRFEQDGLEERVPFADVKRIQATYAENHDPDSANWASYTISLVFKRSRAPLVLAQISTSTRKSARRKAAREDELVALIDSVLQLETPSAPGLPTEKATVRVLTPTPNQNLITENIRKIQRQGGSGNFVIFMADEATNYFIQLSEQQEKQIMTLGWQPPSGNALSSCLAGRLP